MIDAYRTRIERTLMTFAVAALAATAGAVEFEAPRNYYIFDYDSLFGIQSADLNGDGEPDLLATDVGQEAGGGPHILIRLNDGTGQFNETVEIELAARPGRAAIGDLDKDGDLDIVVGFADHREIAVLLNNGNATFRNPMIVETESSSLINITVADFNGDTFPDVLAVPYRDSDPEAVVLLHAGGRTVSFQEPIHFSCAPKTYDIAVEDLNGDDAPDLVFAVQIGANQVLMNQGEGKFATPVNYPAGPFSTDIDLHDMNGDGTLDMVVTNANGGSDAEGQPGTLSILLGNPDGTFEPQTSYPLQSTCVSSAVGDLDGDGDLDVFTPPNGNNPSTTLYFNDGTGKLSAPESFPFDESSVDVVAGDFDKDGDVDLVVTTTNYAAIIQLPNDGNAFFTPPSYPTDRAPGGVATGFLNDDEFPDLVTANVVGDTISVLLGTGEGMFGPPENNDTEDGPETIAIAMMDDDTFADIVVANRQNGSVSIFYGNGDGTFQSPVHVDPLENRSEELAVDIDIADVTGDGSNDIVVLLALTGGNRFVVLENEGNRTFTRGVDTRVTFKEVESIAIADITGDSIPDVVIGGLEEEKRNVKGTVFGRVGIINIYRGTGTGVFQSSATPHRTGHSGVTDIAITDLDGNNTPDIVICDVNTDWVTVFLNEGGGDLGEPTDFPTPQGPEALILGEFNGDSNLDIATANRDIGNVSILEGRGNGTFEGLSRYVVAARANALTSGDFDLDGDLDIAVTWPDADQVTLVNNRLVNGPATPATVDYTFESDREGWNSSSVGDFSSPTSGFRNGRLILTANDNSNTFGFYSGPFTKLPAGDTGLFVAEFKLATSVANRATVPQARVRMNNTEFSYSKFLAVESNGQGEYSPTATPADYPLYFAAPSNLGEVLFSFDLLNFDPTDAGNGDIQLDSVAIRAVDLGSSSNLRVEKTWSFTGSAEGWTSVSTPEAYTAPTFSASGGALNITGVSGDTNTFGFWTSPQEVSMDGSRLYIATFLVSSDVPAASKDRVPQIRMRVNESGLRASTFLAIESNQSAAFSPTSGGSSEFKVYLSAPPASTGAFLIASFDFLNFDPNDDSSATVRLESVLIESVAKP